MKFNINSIFLLVMPLCITSCTLDKNTSTNMVSKPIMEITTFNINAETNPTTFAKRDKQVESDFTSKQPGFIKRQSGVNDKGSYVVIVYWETGADADASMNKFMGDDSVSDYAKMIDGPTMEMSRYTMDKPLNTKESRFVEIMSYNLKSGTDQTTFDELNQKVETEVTSKRNGFVQRLTGVNESGKQVVAVYWASKATSDAALKPFMEAPIAKEFIEKMDNTSLVLGRYSFLAGE